jgi:hypothetical protein
MKKKEDWEDWKKELAIENLNLVTVASYKLNAIRTVALN